MEEHFQTIIDLLDNQLEYSLIYDLPDWRPLTIKQGKSLEQAEYLRKDGNQMYLSCNTEEDFHKVYELYTKSIAHAPANSREMALAYENLSAVLFQLKKHTECLEAIDSCLNLDYPEESKFDIYLRQIECLKIIDQPAKAKDVYEKTLAWIESKVKEKVDMTQKLKKCYQKKVIIQLPFTNEEIDKIWGVYSIKSFNKEIPGASNALGLKYSESQGRHYVAERDIKPGEMLLKDRPYAMVCSYEFSRYQSCWHCCKSLTNCVPCDYCERVIFCSDKCKKQAWDEYHHVECKVLPAILRLSMKNSPGYTDLLITSFRLLVLAINEYGSIQKLKEAYNEIEQLSAGWKINLTKSLTCF